MDSCFGFLKEQDIVEVDTISLIKDAKEKNPGKMMEVVLCI